MSLSYAIMDPRDPALVDLIAHHAAHGDAHYPAESNHHQNGATLHGEGVVLFVGQLDGRPVAMGGYKPTGHAQAEMKSMHVLGAARGQGAGAQIVQMILDHAAASGMASINLETGSLEGSAAARRLYERLGFTYCAPFGSYCEDPNSVFMTRDL